MLAFKELARQTGTAVHERAKRAARRNAKRLWKLMGPSFLCAGTAPPAGAIPPAGGPLEPAFALSYGRTAVTVTVLVSVGLPTTVGASNRTNRCLRLPKWAVGSPVAAWTLNAASLTLVF